jgi:hypothetical protein
VFVRLTLKLGLAPLYPLQHVLQVAGNDKSGGRPQQNLSVTAPRYEERRRCQRHMV